jgi:hypothetical protein
MMANELQVFLFQQPLTPVRSPAKARLKAISHRTRAVERALTTGML